MAGRRQCTHRPTITPNKAWAANFYRHIKRRVGHSRKCAYCNRNLVHSGKQVAYTLSRTEGGISSPKRVPRPLLRQDSSCSNRQYYGRVIHKQERRHEVGPTLCPTVENLHLLFQETSDSKSLTHSRPAECSSRQTIQARPDHPDRVVSPSRGLLDNMQQVAPAQNRPICHEVQQQVTTVCVTSIWIPWPQQWIHSVCHGRIWTHMPSHQQPSWAKWWRSCITDHARVILIAPGGPACLGFGI